jgi:anti-sigma-K factor RskA
MTTTSHEEHKENIAAYLLGALPEQEAEAFERHLATCQECTLELEELRLAADALPRSVEPLVAPETLKKSIMDAVWTEAGEAAPRRRRFPAWLRVPRLARLSPAAAAVMAACLLALGALVGWGITQLGGNEERTVVARVDSSRLPDARGSLEIEEDGEGVLTLRGLPRPVPDQVMQVWLQRGKRVVPSTVFAVREDGTAVAAIPEDLDGVDRVMATREPPGGAETPGEPPPVTVDL